jgi:hypothetical protein
MTSKEKNAYLFEGNKVDVQHSPSSMSFRRPYSSLDQINIVYQAIQIKFGLLKLTTM